MSAKYIKVLHAPDGADYFQTLQKAFVHRPDVLVDNLADEPATYQSVVFVFLLTPAALAATELAVHLRAMYIQPASLFYPLLNGLPIIDLIHYLTTCPTGVATDSPWRSGSGTRERSPES